MTIYAIGNIQGGYASLLTLLDNIQFDKEQDLLCFTGNVVGHGEDSLAILRFIKSLGKSVISILGKEELELLVIAEGIIQPDDKNLYAEILSAPDCEELLKWLRRCPLMHYDKKSNFAVVHAGIPAEWTLSQARTFAIEVESALSFGNHKAFLENLSGNPPRRWNAKLHGWKRLHFIVSAFTCMHLCNEKGYMDFGIKIPATEYIPWYQQQDRITSNVNIIFNSKADMAGNEQYPGIYPIIADNSPITAWKITDTAQVIGIA